MTEAPDRPVLGRLCAHPEAVAGMADCIVQATSTTAEILRRSGVCAPAHAGWQAVVACGRCGAVLQLNIGVAVTLPATAEA